MRTRRADSPRFGRLRERRQARDSWSDLEHDDDGWLGKLKPEFAADDELGPDTRPPRPQTPRPSVTRPAIAEDPLRRSSPLRSAAPPLSASATEGADHSLSGPNGSPFGRARSATTFDDPDDAAKHVAETVERASAAIDAARSELDQANAWAQKTKALQLSEEQIGQLLLGAKRTAGETIADAQRRADLVVRNADVTAAEIVKNAELRAADVAEDAKVRAATIVAAAQSAATSIAIAAQAPSSSAAAETQADPDRTSVDSTVDVQATLNAFAESNARLSNEISSLIRALDNTGER